jgi:hypothetical protein
MSGEWLAMGAVAALAAAGATRRRGSPSFAVGPSGTRIGWRCMRYDPTTHEAVSGANSRIRLPVRAGIHRMPGKGMHLGNTADFVLDYYCDHDHTILMQYAFDPARVTGGDLTGTHEAEITVPEARLVRWWIWSEDEDPPQVERRQGSPSAVARRSRRVDDRWREEPAHLTPDHQSEPQTLAARQWAAKVFDQGVELGQGNFGVSYRVDTSRGPVVVKIPAKRNIHGEEWDRKRLRGWFLHEAGVANELTAKGYRVVPWTVFVDRPLRTEIDHPELPFALVREYGEEVRRLTPEEWYSLERSLYDLEVETGWHPNDDLLVLRRPDGSLFIGDVGIWSAPSSQPQTDIGANSSLSWMLQKAAGQLVSPQAAKAPPLSSLLYSLRRAQDFETEIGKRQRRLGNVVFDMWADLVEDLRRDAERRQAAGLVVPSEVRAYTDRRGRP